MHKTKIDKPLSLFIAVTGFVAQFFCLFQKAFDMINNLVEAIRKNLGYPPLQKVDPNSQEIKEIWSSPTDEKLAQAAIPSVLTALFKMTRTMDGCNALLATDGHADWLSVIFNDRDREVVEKLAQYSGAEDQVVERNMEDIADEAVKLVKESVGEKAGPEKVRNYMNGQRHHILVHLPAQLNMGDLLNDEGLDDRTNKMEGPVSNFMHKIENKLAGGES
ncbi:MAG TPA: hypothetical protein VLJ68_03470 [Chitinophagaceae bacterium]|nr:hypothetical protein [Chitinophagaceae bacterium]